MSLLTAKNTTYANGSQVKSADLNEIQEYIAHLFRYTNEGLLRGLFNDLLRRPATGATARPLGRAGVIYGQTSGNGPTVKFKGGLWVSTGGPSERPILHVYTDDDDSRLNVALPAYPGAGNFQRHIISVRVTYSLATTSIERVVTSGVVAGTENGATEPAVPGGGYTKIASVLLSGAGPGTGDVTKIRDWREPLGRRIIEVPLLHTYDTDDEHVAAGWSRIFAGLGSDAAAARVLLIPAWPHVGLPFEGRVLKVGLLSKQPNNGVVQAIAEITRHDLAAGADDTAGTLLKTVTSSLTEPNVNTWKMRYASLATPTGVTTEPDHPIWLNGYPAPYLNEPTAEPATAWPRLFLKYTSTSNQQDFLRVARFEIAGFTASEIV